MCRQGAVWQVDVRCASPHPWDHRPPGSLDQVRPQQPCCQRHLRRRGSSLKVASHSEVSRLLVTIIDLNRSEYALS